MFSVEYYKHFSEVLSRNRLQVLLFLIAAETILDNNCFYVNQLAFYTVLTASLNKFGRLISTEEDKAKVISCYVLSKCELHSLRDFLLSIFRTSIHFSEVLSNGVQTT